MDIMVWLINSAEAWFIGACISLVVFAFSAHYANKGLIFEVAACLLSIITPVFALCALVAMQVNQ